MKLSTQLLIVLLLLIAAFIAGTLSCGGDEVNTEHEKVKQKLHDRIAILNREKENIARLGEQYRNELDSIRVKYSEQINRKALKISNVKKRVDSLKVVNISLYNPECTAIIAAQDTVILELESTIVILKEEKSSTWNSFNQIIDTDKAMIDTLQAEVEAYKEAYDVTEVDLAAERKEKKKARRQRNLAVVLGVLLVGLAVTN
jgi:hypothetical protein